MSKSLWSWILVGSAIVLIGSYGVLKIIGREPVMPTPVLQNGVPGSSGSVDTQKAPNPLLTADKVAVARWFPGQCFAELYNRDPSFGGKLIPGCVIKVIQQVKAETGVTLEERDIRSSEVLAHFKRVYGDDNLWRQ